MLSLSPRSTRSHAALRVHHPNVCGGLLWVPGGRAAAYAALMPVKWLCSIYFGSDSSDFQAVYVSESSRSRVELLPKEVSLYHML